MTATKRASKLQIEPPLRLLRLNVDTIKQTDLKPLTFARTALFDSTLTALANETKSIWFGV